jgi:hypothetical protein
MEHGRPAKVVRHPEYLDLLLLLDIEQLVRLRAASEIQFAATLLDCASNDLEQQDRRRKRPFS